MAYIPKRVKKKPAGVFHKERQRVYQSGKWKPIRDAYIASHPLCEDCLAAGVTTVAEDVHHIRSFMEVPEGWQRDALAYDWENLVSLCRACHRKRHAH